MAAFLDSLDGELLVEEAAYLPLSVAGTRVSVSGVVDLIHVGTDRVAVVDYKTDRSRRAEAEYRTQLSVYYHVVRAAYPDRAVSTAIFYTHEGELVELDPLSEAELSALVAERT